MENNRKQGQTSGLEVSILIVLMALFIGAYVILLPPEDRSGLLGELKEGATAAEEPEAKNVLLSESPGTVQGYKKNIQEAKLEPMHLYVKDETTTQTLVKSLTVSKTVIKDNYKNVLFSIDNPSDLRSAKIALMITESKGNILIKLNGYQIYEGRLTAADMPLTLPKEYIKEKNVLDLSAESPGWKIFSSNYYLIKDFNLIKETTTKKTKASRSFSVDTTDNTIKKASLEYFINCNKASKGELTITLNGKQMFQDEVFCEYLDKRTLTLTSAYLNGEGKNTLGFEINEGDYNIDELKLKMTLEKSTHPSYTFELSSDNYDKIQAGKLKAHLKITFPTESRKKATIFLNNKQFTMDLANREYKRDISELLKLGTNTLRVEPQETFEITKLQVLTE